MDVLDRIKVRFRALQFPTMHPTAQGPHDLTKQDRVRVRLGLIRWKVDRFNS